MTLKLPGCRNCRWFSGPNGCFRTGVELFSIQLALMSTVFFWIMCGKKGLAWYWLLPLSIVTFFVIAGILYFILTVIYSLMRCRRWRKCPQCGSRLTFENEQDIKALRSRR